MNNYHIFGSDINSKYFTPGFSMTFTVANKNIIDTKFKLLSISHDGIVIYKREENKNVE